MRKLKVFLAALVICLMGTCMARADESGERPDYYTDYYMIVESKGGGIDLYSSASKEVPKINEELIPNGTALHIEGEKEDKDKRTWGYVQYHGMHGYVPLDDCKPVRRSEAIRSELSVSEKEDVSYDVEVSSREKAIFLYNGPGEKFDRVSNAQEIPNGEKLSISQEITSEDTGKWGLTEYQGTEGWVALDETKEWKEKELPADMVEMKLEENKVTPEDTGKWGLTEYQGTEGWVALDETKEWKEKELPADMVEMKLEENKVTPTPSKEPVPSATPTPSKEPVNTPTPVPTVTASPTPSPKAEITPQVTVKEEKTLTRKPTEKTPSKEPVNTPTPVPTVTASPTPSPKAEITPQVTVKEEKTLTRKPTEKPEITKEADQKSEEAKEASGKQISSSASWFASPFVWIGILSLLAVILLLIYHFKKR